MIIVMENEALRVVVNTLGGHIEEVVGKLSGSNHYWSYDPSVWPRRTSVCFPVCGAMQNGGYTYRGNEYEMPMHGFLREQNLKVLRHTAQEVCLEAVQTQETLRQYPFVYVFQILYRLQGKELHVTYRVNNPSSEHTMLFATGSHYTYQVPIRHREQLEDYCFSFSPWSDFTWVELEDGLVSKNTRPFLWHEGISLGELDDGAILIRCPLEPAEHTITLENAKTGSKTAVTFQGFAHCVLWRPFPDAPFVCIEPWSGTPEQVGSSGALETKHAMTELLPGAQKNFHLCISVD